MRNSSGIPHVLLLVETTVAYGRGIVEGIARYALEHGPWSLEYEARGLESMPPQWLKKWPGDGIITRTVSAKAARMLKATQLPLVELLGSTKIGIAQVRGDFRAMSEMAAEHFCNTGLRYFAYFTLGEVPFITEHRACFIDVLKAKGYECHLYRAPVSKEVVPHWDERQRANVLKWISELPRPIGIFTPGDSHAVRLLNLCRDANVDVPQEAAILGVGNDLMMCESIRPTLSSLDLDPERIGYEAARLLDRKMAGEKVDELILVPPNRVEVRQSTDLMIIEDADVVQALRFIRDNACRGIEITDVAEEVGLSLSGLGRKFHHYLGRTPKAEIMRVQIEHAKKLLSQTDRSGASIAKKSGFHSVGNFIRAFHRETGMTPNAYRSIDRTGK
jgi:LacI family transcriptional regulator